MKKKIAFVLALLIMLTASLSAQAVSGFLYLGNQSEQYFNSFFNYSNSSLSQKGWTATNKLPNPVIQKIYNNLSNYSLNSGDLFGCELSYQGVTYLVNLRITDAKNSKWQFYAWYRLVR